MCLAVPGEILTLSLDDALPQARVSFGGAVKTICIAYTPDAEAGDYVLVHAGFSISVIDEREARKIIAAYEGDPLERGP